MAIAYDSTGAGYVDQSGTSTISGSWNQVVTSSGGTVVVIITDYSYNVSYSGFTVSATCGGTAMTFLGAVNNNNTSFGWTAMFGLTGVSSGTKSIAISITGSPSYAVVANSTSYSGATGFGTFASAYGSGSLSHTVSAATGNMVVQGFGAVESGGTGTITLSSYSQSQRYMQFEFQGGSSISGEALQMGDAPGASTVSFTATVVPSGTYWGSVAIPLTSGGGSPITVTPTTATIAFTGGTPAVTTTNNITAVPTTATIAFTGGTPTVTATQNKFISPTTATIAFTGGTPTVSATQNKFISPTTAVIAFTGGVPLITVGGNITAYPTPAALTFTTGTPLVTATNNIIVNPTPAAIHFTGGLPIVTTPVNIVITPTTALIIFTGGGGLILPPPPERLILLHSDERLIIVPADRRFDEVHRWHPTPTPPPPPPPIPTPPAAGPAIWAGGTVTHTIQSFKDTPAAFVPAWQTPVTGNAHLYQITTPHGPGIGMTCTDADTAIWDSTDKVILAQGTQAPSSPDAENTISQWNTWMYLPSQTFPAAFFSGVLWEVHTQANQAHSAQIDTNQHGTPTAPYWKFYIQYDAGGNNVHTYYSTTPIALDVWHQVVIQAKWSQGTDGVMQWFVDGVCYANYQGQTYWTAFGKPYVQFGYYSQRGAGLTNTVQFGPMVRRQFTSIPT
jgi:hypothetical protein